MIFGTEFYLHLHLSQFLSPDSDLNTGKRQSEELFPSLGRVIFLTDNQCRSAQPTVGDTISEQKGLGYIKMEAERAREKQARNEHSSVFSDSVPAPGTLLQLLTAFKNRPQSRS